MKNRYCLFCGTLLPEDGVCLRCGARYELADDGQMRVTPRKVKRVLAKPSVKKKTIGKKKLDPSEAETQTIPIPEDIFSFSDDAKRQDKHSDWSGNSSESSYEPNFVLYDEPLKQDNPEASFNADIVDESERATSNKSILKWTLFILLVLIVAGITFLLLHNNLPKKTTIRNNPIALSQEKHDINYNNFSVNYTEPADAVSYFNNLCITDDKGNERVRYKYDAESKELSIFTITSGLSNEEYWLDLGLLPLITPDKRNNNLLIGSFVQHEPMGNEAISDDSLEIIFALSDYIRSGIIKSLDYGGRKHSFEVDQKTNILNAVVYRDDFGEGDIHEYKSTLEYNNNYLSKVRFDYRDGNYFERTFMYNEDGQLSQYRYKDYSKFRDEETTGPRLIKTEEAWVYNYSSDNVLDNAVGGFEDSTFHKDFTFNKNGQLIRMEEHFDSDDYEDHGISHSFSYNEKGELTRLVKDSGDKELDPIANFEYAVPLSESTIPWRLAYQKHLSELIKGQDILNYGQVTFYKFAFIKRNNSSVPELFVSYDMSHGSHICHFDGKNVSTTQTNMDYYLEDGTVVIEHGGGMDYYNTNVIGFDNNSWQTLFEGEFHAAHDVTGFFDSFKIDGKQVTREQYNKTLTSFMNPDNLSINMRELNYDRLLSYEECWDELASGSITYYSGDVIGRDEILIPPTYDEWIEQRE